MIKVDNLSQVRIFMNIRETGESSYLQINQSIWTTKELLYGHGHILLKRLVTKCILETHDVTNLVFFHYPHELVCLKKTQQTSVSRKAPLAFIHLTMC